MSGDQQPGATRTPTRPAGRRGGILWGVAAIAICLALVDAGVETFRSASPLRWWVVPPILAFVAASTWFWRPGGTPVRRFGSAGAAATSSAGLLALFAATAWLPGGQAGGVQMMHQPTSTLLTALTGLAVVLAAFVLIRAVEPLPPAARLIARTVFFALAAYADQIGDGHHFGADEAAGEVGVDAVGRLQRGPALAQEPGADLLLAGGEKDHLPRGRKQRAD